MVDQLAKDRNPEVIAELEQIVEREVAAQRRAAKPSIS